MPSPFASSRGQMFTPEEVAARVEAVRARIDELGGSDVGIVAVTKGFGADAVLAARSAGLVDVGESYAQEVLEKAEVISEGSRLHFIGRIQRNKVRKIAEYVDLWHSVARPEILVEIGKRRPGSTVLVQVRAGDDPTKDGVEPEAVGDMLEVAAESGVEVIGLMTIGVLGDADATRDAFRTLRGLVDRHGLDHASMGMSGDYELAVAEGATMLRLGSILFGPRPR